MKLTKYIILSLVLLCWISVTSVISATLDQTEGDYWLSNTAIRHLVFWLFGIFIFGVIVLGKLNISLWKVFMIFGYTLFFALTVIVLQAPPIKGSSRWLSIGIINIQPSEFLKIFFIGVNALILAQNIGFLFKLFLTFFVTLLTTIPVLIQPDLGTSILYFLYWWLGCFFVSRRITFLIFSLILGSLVSILAWEYVLRPYQKQRIESLIFGGNKLDQTWQVTQALIALGSGGVFGKGFLNGTQSRYELLPERHTDFIFSSFGEEFGLVGCLIIISIYILLISSLFRLSLSSKNEFVKIYIALASSKISLEVTFNILMNLGLFPVVGIALPFMSYGGSNLISNLILLGTCLTLHKNEPKARIE